MIRRGLLYKINSNYSRFVSKRDKAMGKQWIILARLKVEVGSNDTTNSPKRKYIAYRLDTV